MEQSQILIGDLGGQYTLLIARRLRERGVRSVVCSSERMDEWLGQNHPKGIILSGGWASVHDANAPHVPDSALGAGVPVLGICLGMHWLAKKFGGVVGSSVAYKEYGVYEFTRTMGHDPLFRNIPEKSQVRLSHGDSVTALPKCAHRSGRTRECPIAAFTIPEKNIFAVQFHPECAESQYGSVILQNFLDVCGTVQDWNPSSIVEQIRSEVINALPKKSPVIHLFSGGVDSTVIAAILEPILRERLICVTFDTGGLREGEMRDIRRNAVAAKCSLHCIDAKKECMVALAGLTDAQSKRLAFQRAYQEKVEEMKVMFGTSYAIQGTLAADLIESGIQGNAALIKTHHNVGVESINPLRDFFKDEVREIARFLKLPDSISERMPCPGLALFIRIIGMPITEESVVLVRWADARGNEIIRAHGIEKNISQFIIALVGVPTAGVKGDARSIGYSIVVRAMQSIDFMTGSGYEIPSSTRRALVGTLTQHPRIVRVWFDETPKPPATFELE